MSVKSMPVSAVIAAILIGVLLGLPETGATHCDTMDGPVVKAAQKALETGNVNVVLMWVQEKDEAEVKGVFEKALIVRKTSSEAKALADMYFFETLVRIHRAGEGAPYTGLKPAGSSLEPAVAEADKALESESVESLVKHLLERVANGINQRFIDTLEKRQHAGESVPAGREFVRSYVEFVHYVEKLHSSILGNASEHTSAERHEDQGRHHHQ